MAEYDDWSEEEFELFEQLTVLSEEAFDDRTVQALFDAAFFQGRYGDEFKAIRKRLADYLMEHYNIDLNKNMNWGKFREWYERNAAYV